MFAFDSLKLRLGDCLQMSVVAEDLGEQTFFGANLGNATVGLTFEPTIVTEFFAALMGSHRNWRLGAVDSAGSHQCLTGNHIIMWERFGLTTLSFKVARKMFDF